MAAWTGSIPGVGGLAETHPPGSSLGATFTRIIVDQFTRLGDGDRFWHQSSLPAEVLGGVRATTLVDVIRRNTGLTNLQPEAFFFRTAVEGVVFADGNRDGIRQSVETGLDDVAVSLVDAAGTVVAATRTNRQGGYALTRLDLGSYRVVVTPPQGSGSVTSRPVRITRGGGVLGIGLGLVPPGMPAGRRAAAFALPRG